LWWIPKKGLVTYLFPWEGDQMGCTWCMWNNAQCCSSVNHLPVISQFVCEKNQSSICREMHGCGHGVFRHCRRACRGFSAF
jgi:protein tyrosine phosphatase (PTP) superfamily phosphohydrolase (DUF442 family)